MLYDVFAILAGKFLTKRENKTIGVILINLHYEYRHTYLPLFIASVLWFNFHFMESLCHFYSFVLHSKCFNFFSSCVGPRRVLWEDNHRSNGLSAARVGKSFIT